MNAEGDRKQLYTHIGSSQIPAYDNFCNYLLTDGLAVYKSVRDHDQPHTQMRTYTHIYTHTLTECPLRMRKGKSKGVTESLSSQVQTGEKIVQKETQVRESGNDINR